jgi:protein-S-isoprenylcysteine O-methyltransferase Ste14
MWGWVKSAIFTVLVPGTVAVYVPYRLVGRGARPDFSGAGPLGVLLIACGAAIYFWCLWHFTVTGRGTPAPIDPPKVLVAKGLYRYVRNPMYIGVASAIGGQAILFRSRAVGIYLFWAFVTINLFVLFYEEPVLRGKFGEAYEKYCEQVPRWIPRLWPRKPHSR